MTAPNREELLASAFSDIPASIAGIPLRPLSAGSFSLLGRLKNPMMVGGDSDDSMRFDAVIQYVWVHAADLDQVLAVRGPDDVPAADLARYAFQIPLGEAFAFLLRYQESALRMTASLAEVEPETDGEPGKPESAPAGSPASSSPAVALGPPPASATSCGPPPSSARFPTCTPPTLQMEQPADGSLTILPAPEELARSRN